MKKVKIPLEDLMIVLDAMAVNGTEDIIIFEYNNRPAIADANEPENIITFALDDDATDEDVVH